MPLKLHAISNTRGHNYQSDFEHAVRDSIDDIAKGDSYSFRDARIEDKLEATQRIMANLIEHFVKKGLMTNEEFQTILEQNEYHPSFKLVEEEENV